MPPARLLAQSRRAAEFFSSSTNLPRYCSLVKKTSDDPADVDRDLPALNGSVNKSGTYRCPPGSKDLDASLLKIIGRQPGGAMDRRHRVRYRSVVYTVTHQLQKLLSQSSRLVRLDVYGQYCSTDSMYM